MKTNLFLAGVAMAAVLVLSGTAQAQVLGGGVTAGIGGSIAGGRGDMGAMSSGRIGARPGILNATRSLGSPAHDRAAQTVENTRQRAGALNTTAGATGQAAGEAGANLGASGDAVATDVTGALSGNAGLNGESAATAVHDAATADSQSQTGGGEQGGAMNSAVQSVDSHMVALSSEALNSAEFPRPNANVEGGANAAGDVQVSSDNNANPSAEEGAPVDN